MGRAWLGLGLRAAGSPCENCLVSGQGQILSYGRARALAQSPDVSASSPLSPQLQCFGLVLAGGWGEEEIYRTRLEDFLLGGGGEWR